MSAAITPTEVREHAEGEALVRGFGWYAMVFFLASEAVFFANLIAAYLYLRVRAGQWPPEPMGPGFALERTLPIIATLVLLSSSFPMHFGSRAIARGEQRKGALLIGATAVLGAIFLSCQAWEYTHAEFNPSTNIFGSTFFTLTGFHGAHVTGGVLFLLVIFFRASKGHFSKDKHFAVTAVEMYWHFVDAVWIVLFSVLYLL
jgi:heme/copper-type cytochrome/quinol oxidase subunit 3